MLERLWEREREISTKQALPTSPCTHLISAGLGLCALVSDFTVCRLVSYGKIR
jgi:hypothetical protein